MIKPFILVCSIFCFFLVFTSCGVDANGKSDSIYISEFNSSKLSGKYQLELKEAIASSTQIDSTDDGWERFGKGIVKLAIQNLDIQFEFLKAGKGNVYVSGGVIDFFQAFSEEELEIEPHPFEYDLRNDSFIYVKDDESGEYKPMGVLNYCNTNYDTLCLSSQSDTLNYKVFLIKQN